MVGSVDPRWLCGDRFAAFGRSLNCSLRDRKQYSGNPEDVACCHGELEVLIDATQPAVHGLSNPSDGLAPAEVLLDALANRLAKNVPAMPGGAGIDDAAPASAARMDRDVRRDLALAAARHEVLSVVGLVSAQSLALRARVGGAPVRVVGARLALPVGLGVAARARGRLVVAAVLGLEALVARPRLDKGTVHREVALREQPLRD